MTITEEYHALKNKVLDKYNELKKAGVDFVALALPEYSEEHQEEIKAIIESKNLIDLCDYEFQEFLPKVYYNNSSGEETEAYALSVTEKDGILIFDADDYTKTFYIGFNDINALWSQIELLECME